MAVFFDHKVQSPVQGQFTDIQWHKTAPLLAVACVAEPAGNGVVNLFMEEGDHVTECQLKRTKPASVICWHPVKKIIATGWETGEISMWNQADRELNDVFPLHKSEITILRWSSSGSRLLSGDALGLLILWKVDSKGKVQQNPICQHQLGEQLLECVLRPPPLIDPAHDIAALARAAVSGDESALDMFNWKKGKANARSMLVPTEALTFYIGGQNGNVTYLNEANKPVIQFTTEGPVRKLLFYEERSILITVTTTMILTQHSVSEEGDCTEMLKVKLSGKPDHAEVLWAGKGILGQCTGETVIRMWDVDKEENFVLNLENNPAYERTENINCIAYCPHKKVLAAGTSAGHVAMWKFTASGHVQEPEDRWSLQPPSVVDGPISDLAWGSSKNLLAVNTVDEAFILSEQVMSAHCCEQTAVVQTGPMTLSVDIFTTNKHQTLKTDIPIKGIYTTKDVLAVWDYKRIVVYEVSAPAGEQALIRSSGTFTTETMLACLHEQNVYTIDEPGKVKVNTHQGTVKQLLSFTELEGNPCYIDVCNKFLVVGTNKGCLRLYDLARREAKQIGNTKNLTDVISDLGSIESVKCNCTGSRVSILVNKVSGKPDPKLYIWDVELDTLQFFNFETGHSEQDELLSQQNEAEQDMSAEERGKRQAARDISGRHAVSHTWDESEHKLLVCEARELAADVTTKQQKDSYNQNISLTKATMSDTVELMVVALFVTSENGVVIQDSFALSNRHACLIGLHVPFYYFVKKADVTKDEAVTVDSTLTFSDRPQTSAPPEMSEARVTRRVMRDFIGLEDADKTARDAMMNFSFYLTIGNMDEAFKAIKLIKSESVWENMAKMCVKNRRLDVAAVCLGNMQHARGAKALREALQEPELDARVAVLAMQLGLHEDAERLFKNCKRYDLLNLFYQSTGQWGRALETAEMYDRVHLRTTYYNYARNLEAKGDINGAIPNYEKSDTHRFEVPRMLFDEPSALEAYIMKTKDKTLRKWWAQYMESSSEMSTALQFYESAQDVLSLVRVYCYCGQIDKAAEICNTSGDKAACYHLARQYENNELFKDAVHFFTRAGAYGNAIRLSKESGGEDQLMNLALLGKSEDMVEAARYYEAKPGCQDKAVMLYHKAGHFSKALDMAFQTKQFAALQVVSEDLDETTDPQLLQRCADFFIENSQFDRAVDLLALAKRYWDALKICMEQHVPMTEDLVEKLTPGKEMGDAQPDERNKILEGIAEVCMQQREYHLATKKYTQAGNKMKAMKALLKSGDTEKIIFFAGVSRQKEIYVMAANYLQSLDWRKDPEIMKNIIGFYTKGRAQDSLSSFYDACAQVEIDEYQNYEKGLGALNEAYKCLSKAKVNNTSLQEDKLADMQRRMTLLKKFIQAKRVYVDDAEEAIKQVQILLEEKDVDVAVRIGDLCSFLVEHYASKHKWQAAFSCMEELRSRMPRVNIAHFVDMKTMEHVHRALDIPMKDSQSHINGYRNSPEDEMGEVVEEDVQDEIYD